MYSNKSAQQPGSRSFESIKSIIQRKYAEKGPVHAKYEFQEYGLWLSEQLHDKKHKTLYIKFAKEKPRGLLEEARIFSIDYKTSSINRGKIFMWKLQQLENESK